MEVSPARAPVIRAWIIAVLWGSAVFLFPALAHAASLFISPSTESVAVGQTFTMSADVSSPDEAMNAASGDISFPSDKLQVLSVSKTNSIMNLWVRDPSFTNSQAGGDVHFEGIVLNPGFTGNSGNLVTITFEAIAAGDAPVTFTSGAVLANDGNGTNILTVMQPADVTISPRSSTPLPPPRSGPAPAGSSPLGPLTITELPGQDPTNPQPLFTWSVGGALSRGLTYMAKIGSGDWFSASTIAVPGANNEYQLPLQAPTSKTDLTVEAYDPAGNITSSTVSFSITPIPSPSIDDFTRVVPASDQLFSAEGTAPTGTTVRVYLQQSDSMITYIAETDRSGQWSVAGEKSMAPGTWQLSAQASDARGALSVVTSAGPLKVNSWFNDLFGQVVDWAIVGLVLILLLGGIIFLALNIVHRIRVWRISSNKEIIELENRLRSDIQKVEQELDREKRAKDGGSQPTKPSEPIDGLGSGS